MLVSRHFLVFWCVGGQGSGIQVFRCLGVEVRQFPGNGSRSVLGRLVSSLNASRVAWEPELPPCRNLPQSNRHLSSLRSALDRIDPRPSTTAPRRGSLNCHVFTLDKKPNPFTAYKSIEPAPKLILRYQSTSCAAEQQHAWNQQEQLPSSAQTLLVVCSVGFTASWRATLKMDLHALCFWPCAPATLTASSLLTENSSTSNGHGRLWPNRLWPTDFGQPFWLTVFGQTDFGQRWCFSGMADFGQNRLWPNRLRQNRLRPKPTLAQTDFGQTDFGQTDFGPNRLWPNRLWPNRL